MDREESGIFAILGAISRALLAASGLMILLMAFTATYGVARRYLLHNPEPYSYEIGMMLLLWCFVLAVAAVQEEQRHLRGDFILNRLPRRLQFCVNSILSPSLAALCSAVLAWKGWNAAMFSLQIGERSMSSWSEPLFPVKAVIPVGYGFLFVVALAQFIRGMHAFIGRLNRRGETRQLPAGPPDTAIRR